MPSAEHEAFAAGLAAVGPLTPEVLPDPATTARLRQASDEVPASLPADVVLTAVDAGGVPALWVEVPQSRPDRVVVFLHGGGYIWMSARSHTLLAAQIARAARVRCLSLDYRLAPQHPFPAPVEDTVAACRWLAARGIEPGRTVLVGESAGGGLVLAALIALRDAGEKLPAAGACVSPWTDLTVSGASADAADDPVVTGTALRAMAAGYLAGADPTAPTASPLFADPRGLPPLHLQVGTREALLDDAVRFAERARAAGVDVTLVRHPGVVHMWVVLGPDLPETAEAIRALATFVDQRTADSSPSRR